MDTNERYFLHTYPLTFFNAFPIIMGIAVGAALFIGVILSMIIMLFVTKLLLKAAVGLRITNPKAYCA